MGILHFPDNKAAEPWHWLSSLTVFWKVRSPFQREFSTKCDLVITLSIPIILSFSCGHPVAVYVIFLVFPSLLFFPLLFLQYHVLEGISYSRCDQSTYLPSFYCSQDISLFLGSIIAPKLVMDRALPVLRFCASFGMLWGDFYENLYDQF